VIAIIDVLVWILSKIQNVHISFMNQFQDMPLSCILQSKESIFQIWKVLMPFRDYLLNSLCFVKNTMFENDEIVCISFIMICFSFMQIYN